MTLDPKALEAERDEAIRDGNARVRHFQEGRDAAIRQRDALSTEKDSVYAQWVDALKDVATNKTERDAALAEIEKLNAAITTLTRKLEGAKAETESWRVTAGESVKNADRWRIAHDRIEEENFALAANQCHAGYSDEGGSHRCREVDAAIETKGRFDTPDENGCWYGVEKCTLPHCDCEKLTAVLAPKE
jgi:chromosome segregation ATPase